MSFDEDIDSNDDDGLGRRPSMSARFWRFDNAMKIGLVLGFALALSVLVLVGFEIGTEELLGLLAIVFVSVAICRLIEILFSWILGAISFLKK